MRIFNLRFIVLAVALLTNGCATALTLGTINPGEGERDKRYDSVEDVKAAYRDSDGNVTLCVTGMPAGGNYWLGPRRDYSITFPAASSPELDVFYHETIPRYRLTAANVKRTCPDEGTPLPVHSVQAREFAEKPGDRSWSGMSEEKLAAFFENTAEAPAIYEFHYDPFADDTEVDLMKVVYASEAPLKGSARAVEIATDRRTVEGQPGYILLLPFAVVFDIVMLPLELAAALMHAG